ncbi:aspartate aminotransferase family protein [Saccharothrix deserti]|uniref:aspartate aminotransferase family protein n=1 Tax=Saccharothrix deserti TaxID=2593674 RepID=UPI00131EBF3D|nr:aminotransferase class III-fold pyridoxal phosphate-dependent enzyme [Saccharothrix deserti]
MNSSVDRRLAEPHMRDWLSTVGLDVEYVRAAGTTLYRLDEQGREVPVLDLTGGYGSLLLGHHHPELVEHAKRVLDAGTPVLAQLSRHPLADRVAERLNAILHREFDTHEPYQVVFANTGAEAIEAAIKHAELDRVLRLGAVTAEIAANVERARAALADGAVPDGDVDLDDVARHNAEQLARPPLFLALEGGFHGKLMGSVQLTHNPQFREPFAALGAQARFVPAGRPEELKRVVDEESLTLRDVVVDGAAVRVVDRPAPAFCAFVLEPIQGEGGITSLTREFADEVRRVCAEVDCPVIVDEVQSGTGRSGAFFAASHIGLLGDYVALGKSLGGGLAKTSAVLVRQSRYRPEFEFVHSSTFAKDGFSSAIALKVLDLLEADGGRAYRTVAERGERLLSALRAIRADFPDVVKDVRGRGLMAGLEFHDQSGSASEAIGASARAGFLGYAISGHLLREHRIRTFPTASAVNTLRFQPSLQLTDAEVDRLDVALRTVCDLLSRADGQALLGG